MSTIPKLTLPLLQVPPLSMTPDKGSVGKHLVIGFVSAHYRSTHSICKLFCGLFTSKSKIGNDAGDRANFKKVTRQTFIMFSGTERGNEEDILTAAGSSVDSSSFREISTKIRRVKVGKFVLNNREEVTSRNVDILVYLDLGKTSVYAL